ncbi:inositol-tetrakisphosphate 1-kinase 4-like [Thraustotheca clavata]|uniref:Inositol-tetrakisphosphate 1-kinase n=1 Tax=Thraustotheca clavata TaxID=74557 RepID=A0A1V9Z6R3_9STRA|nr:inositol-tetrakisphosphate 1-kinase 4-like [Thraustotheca clavata]
MVPPASSTPFHLPQADVLRVGMILPLKKARKGRMQELLMSQADGVHVVHVDLDLVDSADDIDAMYGHLDVLLHKLAHDMVFESLGEAKSIKNMRTMKEYIAKHPHIRIVDPLDGVRLLTNRQDVCVMLAALAKSSGLAFSIPNYAIIDSIEAKEAAIADINSGKLRLPVMAKSLEACGTDASHLMQVITRIEDIQALEIQRPIMLQEYINHDGRLYKGYVLGKDVIVSERTSLPNLQENVSSPVEFDTQKAFPTAASFDLPVSPKHESKGITQEMQDSIQAIGRAIQRATHLSLFGFDVIIESRDQRELVIDVNYFPSFKELDDFDAKMRAHLKVNEMC